jgi:chemotaxis family two-component system response regulator PixG
MVAEYLKIDELASQLDEVKRRLFSGRILVKSPRGQEWFLYCYLGRIVYATGGNHPIRRWVRVLSRFGGEQIANLELSDRIRWLTDISALTPTEVQRCWEYYRIVNWARQGRIDRTRLIEQIKTTIIEVMFDIAQAASVTWKLIREEPLTPQLVLIDIEQAYHLSRQKWQRWQSAKLADFSPDIALEIIQPDKLKSIVSEHTYQTLQTILDGKQSIREIGLKTHRSSLDVAKSFLPYLRAGIISTIEVPDFSSPIVATRRDSESLDSTSSLIACIDDNRGVCDGLNQIISRMGYQFVGVLDSSKAIPIMIAKRPQLIFLDLIMPNTNGYEVCSRLRKVSIFRETPIVILTGNDGVVDRVRAKMVGATDFINKPVKQATIREVINQYLPTLSRRYEYDRPLTYRTHSGSLL